MLVFLHLHKAAGTTVVRAAIESGLKLPKNHANGHPTDSEGNRVMLDAMKQEELESFFGKLRDDSVEFLAIEWGFPRIERLDSVPGLQFATVLRDPVDRAISNYRMDMVYQYSGDRVFGFDTYTKEPGIYCADNYYLRFFCDLDHSIEVEQEHFDYAKNVLADRIDTVVLEVDGLAPRFEKYGLVESSFHHFNAANDNTRYQNYQGSASMKVGDPSIIRFIARNAFDYALYLHFVKASYRRQRERGVTVGPVS